MTGNDSVSKQNSRMMVASLRKLKAMLERGHALTIGSAYDEPGRNVSMWFDMETGEFVVESWAKPEERKEEERTYLYLDALKEFVEVASDIATVEALFVDDAGEAGEVVGDGD